MKVRYVERARMPEGHTWAIVERGDSVTLYVVDGVAERVARAIYSRARYEPTEASA